MASQLRNIFAGLKSYFETSLTGVKVILSDPEMGVEGEGERSYPVMAIALYDIQFDAERRTGGPAKAAVDHPTDPDKVNLEGIPTPINLHFQIDAQSERRDDRWDIMKLMGQILGEKYTKVNITGEPAIYLRPTTYITAEGLEEGLWRDTYRFFVQVWFDSLKAAEEAYQVLSVHLSDTRESIEL